MSRLPRRGQARKIKPLLLRGGLCQRRGLQSPWFMVPSKASHIEDTDGLLKMYFSEDEQNQGTVFFLHGKCQAKGLGNTKNCKQGVWGCGVGGPPKLLTRAAEVRQEHRKEKTTRWALGLLPTCPTARTMMHTRWGKAALDACHLRKRQNLPVREMPAACSTG